MNEFRLFPEQGSEMAGRIDALMFYILAVGIAFSLLIFGMIVYLAVRYKRKTATEFAANAPSPLWLEIVWTAVPTALALSMFYWGARLYYEAYRAPENSLDIHVVGKQWMWKMQHPQGRREINELHVPAGQPVRLAMISQDAIHDLYIPAFRAKQDVLPGRYTYLWFNATELGEKHLFCGQYCGMLHSGMIAKVVVLRPAEYAAWLRGASGDAPMVSEGKRLYREFGCRECHGIKAPTLAGLYGSRVTFADGSTAMADESYLREHILSPRSRTVSGYVSTMPSYKGQISEEQLSQLIVFIKTLRPESAGGEQQQ